MDECESHVSKRVLCAAFSGGRETLPRFPSNEDSGNDLFIIELVSPIFGDSQNLRGEKYMSSVTVENLDRVKNPPATPSIQIAAGTLSPGYIILYVDENFNGPALALGMGPGFGVSVLTSPFQDSITSIVVVAGVWQVFVDAGYAGQNNVIGPGAYPNAASFGLPNDSLTSLRCIG
jgi:hypothetical protein